jgi:hypothetical protein
MRSRGCDAFDVTPFDGCVAIVDEGSCSFETKASNAAVAGAAGILVVAATEEVSVMGCRTCQMLQIFGSMISRSDGERLRRITESDSSARIMSVAPHRPASHKQLLQKCITRCSSGIIPFSARLLPSPSTAVDAPGRSVMPALRTAFAQSCRGCPKVSTSLSYACSQIGHVTGWDSIVLEAKYQPALLFFLPFLPFAVAVTFLVLTASAPLRAQVPQPARPSPPRSSGVSVTSAAVSGVAC